MSDLRVIGPGEHLIDSVQELLPTDPAKLSSCTIVFEGKRPGHFLRRALARRLGSSFLPPRVHTFATFVDFLFIEKLGGNPEVITDLDAIGMLYALHREAVPRLGGERYITLEAFVPLGQRIFAALEELRAEQASASRVRAASTGVQFDNGEMLATLYEGFYEWIKRDGTSTPAYRLDICASRCGEVSLHNSERVIFAGVGPSTRSAVTVIRHLLSLPGTTCLIEEGPGASRVLDVLGGTRRSVPAPERKPDVHLYQAGDMHGEVAGLARLIDDMKRKGIPFDEQTVVVVPSPDALFPLIHWGLPDVAEYNISLGYPVVRTPVFGFLAGVWNVLGSMRDGQVFAGDYLRCVLHPYLKNLRWHDSAEATRILFHTIEDVLVRDKGWSVFRLEDLEQRHDLVARIAAATTTADRLCTPEDAIRHLHRIHEKTFVSLQSARTLGEAARRCIDMLLFVAEEGTAGQHTMFRQFAVEIIRRLDEICRSGLAGLPVTSSHACGTLLRQLVEDGVVPFHGTPLNGMQVLGWLETRNLHFTRVCILDMNEDVLPGGDAVDQMLPPQVRSALGLPGKREKEESIEHHLAVLMRGAEEVHLFFRDGGGKERSRFIEKIIWERERETAAATDPQGIRPVNLQTALRQVTPRPIAKTTDISAALSRMSFSATMLDTYLRCPLRFFHAHVLGLAERDEADEELDRAQIGTFVHGVLAEYHRPHLKSILQESSIDTGRLSAIIERRFAESFGADARGQRLLIRLQVEKHLARYFDEWRRPLLAGAPVEVLCVEYRMRCETDGVVLVGTADHIERRGGRTYIMDYKTGADPSRFRIRCDAIDPGVREGWEDAIGSLQLPMYAMLYRSQAGAGFNDIVPVYVMLGKGKFDRSVEIPLFSEGDDVMSVMKDLEAIVFGLIREIRDPGVPFLPTSDLKKQCPQCGFRGMCGTGWVRGWEGGYGL
jgi:ATP-dependent helicase/nuclease subunit B